MNKKVAKILDIVSKIFGVSVEQIRASGRGGEVIHARHAAIGLIRIYLRLTLKQTGKEFSDRDHATVINSLKKWYKLYLNDKDFRLKLNKANKEVARYFRITPVDLFNSVDEEIKAKELKRRKLAYQKAFRIRVRNLNAEFARIQEEEQGGVIRPISEMPTYKFEWLKPLRKNNLENKEVVKPVYFHG